MQMRNLSRLWSIILLSLMGATLSACGINAIPSHEERAHAAWAEVQNQYQRRADLIPNLVETVKGFAAHEKDTLQAIVEARAKATSIKIDASTITDPEAFKRFEAAQNQLSGALSKLISIKEAYPDLKSAPNFLGLQSQLEGTENRIAVARRDYIEAVRIYNTEIKTFPGRFWVMLLYSDAKPMETFSAAPTLATPPQVKF